MKVLGESGDIVDIPKASGVTNKTVTCEWGKPIEPIEECHDWPEQVIAQEGSDTVLLVYVDVCYFYRGKTYFPIPSKELLELIAKKHSENFRTEVLNFLYTIEESIKLILDSSES